MKLKFMLFNVLTLRRTFKFAMKKIEQKRNKLSTIKPKKKVEKL